MNLAATIARSLQADMQAELRDLERAVAAGTKSAGQGLKTELRRQVGGAGLGQRLANSWRDRHYPNRKLDAASLVYTKAPQIIRAFDEGAVIRSTRRDMATRTPRVVRGRLVACLEYSGGYQHQRLVRHLPLGLGLLDLAGLQRRHRARRVLRLILDPCHGAALACRSVRLPAPMERGACAFWQRASLNASLDRHRRGHLHHGVASDGAPNDGLRGAVRPDFRAGNELLGESGPRLRNRSGVPNLSRNN
jgi:hypothetical protein